MCNVFDFGVENWNYGISANFVERNSLTNNCKSFIINIEFFRSAVRQLFPNKNNIVIR